MPELKSCPFCGNEQMIIRYGGSQYTSNLYLPKESGFVQCLRCGCRTSKYMYARKAVEKWNRRIDHEK